MNNLDIVYVLKESNIIDDLRYSLRSLINVTGYNKIWFVGYCPNGTIPDGYIRTAQTKNKWLNSLDNVIAACKNNNITNDFILFNDDFFAINKVNLLTDLNLCCGTLDQAILKFSVMNKSRWRDAHKQTKELLQKLQCKHFDNFAVHIPVMINRKKFLNMMNKSEVINHIGDYRLLSYRSVYGNLNWNNPKTIVDIKLEKDEDIADKAMKRQWVSVRDNVTNNLNKYPKLKSILEKFPKSKYEK